MGCRPILCIFYTVTIDTVIIEKRCVINNGLKNAMCQHSCSSFTIQVSRFRAIARNVKQLELFDVTHVLNAAKGRKFNQVDTSAADYTGAGLQYHGIPAVDVMNFPLHKYFSDAAQFIDETLQSGGKSSVTLLSSLGGRRAACFFGFFFSNFWRTLVLFVGPLMTLFWTFGDVCPGSQSQGGSFACFHTCGILRFTLVWHLLTV